jgi:hypothetical protein
MDAGSASPAKVFICYARENEDTARLVHTRVAHLGIDAWLDKVSLQPGQNWRIEIPKALRSAKVVVILFSQAQLGKRGYVQKELKLAMEVLDETPETEIRVIPVRIEPCDVPERFSSLQWVDLFEPDGLQRLLKSLVGVANPGSLQPADYFEVALPTILRWKGTSATEINKTFSFHVLTAGTWTINLKPPAATVQRDSTAASDLTVVITKTQMRHMVSGTFNAKEAVAAGEIEVSGDLPLLKVIGTFFRD